jgi:hypothetical protein
MQLNFRQKMSNLVLTSLCLREEVLITLNVSREKLHLERSEIAFAVGTGQAEWLCLEEQLNAEVKWLKHYATRRKITGSIPDEVNF